MIFLYLSSHSSHSSEIQKDCATLATPCMSPPWAPATRKDCNSCNSMHVPHPGDDVERENLWHRWHHVCSRPYISVTKGDYDICNTIYVPHTGLCRKERLLHWQNCDKMVHCMSPTLVPVARKDYDICDTVYAPTLICCRKESLRQLRHHRHDECPPPWVHVARKCCDIWSAIYGPYLELCCKERLCHLRHHVCPPPWVPVAKKGCNICKRNHYCIWNTVRWIVSVGGWTVAWGNLIHPNMNRCWTQLG